MTGTGDPDTFRCCFRQACLVFHTAGDEKNEFGTAEHDTTDRRERLYLRSECWVGVEGLGTDPRRDDGFLCGRDDYFCRKETGERDVNDRIRLGKIDFCCENNRFNNRHNCFVDATNRIRSGNDRVRTINKRDAFRNDRLPIRDNDLQRGNYRFRYANNRFRYANDYFLRTVRNHLSRWCLMLAANNRFRDGNNYLRNAKDYLLTENARRRSINDRMHQRSGCLQHGNDCGSCSNNRFSVGQDRVVDQLNRRRNGNTRFAGVADYR